MRDLVQVVCNLAKKRRATRCASHDVWSSLDDNRYSLSATYLTLEGHDTSNPSILLQELEPHRRPATSPILSDNTRMADHTSSGVGVASHDLRLRNVLVSTYGRGIRISNDPPIISTSPRKTKSERL